MFSCSFHTSAEAVWRLAVIFFPCQLNPEAPGDADNWTMSSGELLLLSFSFRVLLSINQMFLNVSRLSDFTSNTKPFCLFLLMLIVSLYSTELFVVQMNSRLIRHKTELYFVTQTSEALVQSRSFSRTLRVPLSNLPVNAASDQSCHFISFVPPSLR